MTITLPRWRMKASVLLVTALGAARADLWLSVHRRKRLTEFLARWIIRGAAVHHG